MKYPMIKEWFTFQEVLNLAPDAPSRPHTNYPPADWLEVLTELSLSYNVEGLSDNISSQTLDEIFGALMNVIYNRHADDYMFYVLHEDVEYELTIDDARKAMCPLLNVLELTLPRYVPLFIQNKNYSADPVAKISSVTEGDTRFNDTPQDGGDFNDDEHATNVSHSYSKSEVDSGSIMDRLEALFKNFKSIILEWSNEFNQLFFKEEQL